MLLHIVVAGQAIRGIHRNERPLMTGSALIAKKRMAPGNSAGQPGASPPSRPVPDRLMPRCRRRVESADITTLSGIMRSHRPHKKHEENQ